MTRRYLMYAAAAMGIAAVAIAGDADRTRADVISATIPVGSSPRVVAVAPNGKVYIADRGPDQVTVINPATNAITKTLTGVFAEPGALHIGTDGRVYVPNRTGNTVTVIDSASDNVITTVPVGLRPAAIDTSDDNSKVVVANERSGTITVLSRDMTTIASLPVAPSRAPHTVVVTANGGKAYVACEATNEIVVVDLAATTPVILSRIPVGLGPGSLRFVGGALFVANQRGGTVSLIDTGTDTVTKTTTVGNAPHGIAVTPNGNRVLVANEASGTITALTASGDVVQTIDLRANPGDASGRPQRIHVTDDGARAYVPNEEAGTVSVIDIASLSVTQTLTAGSMPTSLDIAGSRVFVANLSTNDVSVLQIQSAAPGSTATPVPPTAEASATAPPSATAAPGETIVAGPTLAAGSTATLDQSLTPGDAATPGDGDATASSAVLDGVATPVNGATTRANGTATPRGSATAVRTATTATRTPTPMTGTIPPETTAPASGSGGAPSWIWLAGALMLTGAFGAGGYFFRSRITAQVGRWTKR